MPSSARSAAAIRAIRRVDLGIDPYGSAESRLIQTAFCERMGLVRKKKKNTVAATAVAAMTAAGMMVGGAVSSPEEALTDGPDAIVQTVSPAPRIEVDAGGGDGGLEEAVAVEEEKKRGRFAAARKAVREAPFQARVRMAVPILLAGTLLTAFLSSLLTGLLPPLLSAALGWALTALMAVLTFTLAVKTVLPDLPLKKILNKRSVLSVGLLCLVCAAADAALPFFWDDWTKLSKLAKLLGSFLCTVLPAALFLHRYRRTKPVTVEAEPVEPEPEPEPELSPEEKERLSRELVAELADSVCPRV